MSTVYGDAVIQAERRLWKVEESTTHEGILTLGAAMASLQQVGSGLVEALSTVLNTPFNTLASQQGTADISSRVESTLGQLALQQVRFSRLTEIRSYLLQNPDLLDLLPALCKTVSERFDPNTKQQLEYHQDPQYEDDQYLVLYLKSETFDLSMIEKIDSITDAYSETFANITGWILIMPDFRYGN